MSADDAGQRRAGGGSVARLEAMLERGRDDSLLRFGLGNAYLQAGDAAAAVRHLRAALQHDAGYSAAWKLLGKALLAAGDDAAAAEAYRQGIDAAETGGDLQAAREMRVFLRRIERSGG